MSSLSRFGGQSVVNSFNLFVDTERTNICGDHSSTGDDVNIHFEGSSIIANEGELIKLTLTNFSMYNNTYGVDVNNDKITTQSSLKATPSIFTSGTTRITDKNYGTLGELAIEIAKKLASRINALNTGIKQFTIVIDNLFKNTAGTDVLRNSYSFSTTGASVGGVPVFANTISAVPLSMSETCNRLFDIKITCFDTDGTTPYQHGFHSFNIQSPADKGDFANLIGGLRLDDTTNATFQSIKTTMITSSITTTTIDPITSVSTTTTTNENTGFHFQGFFPMQRTTDPFVYLRCNLSQSGGLESATLASDTIVSSSNNSDLTSSTILAKLNRDVEFINYENTGTDEYFINLQQRKLSNIKLTLTDSKNRPLGRRSDTDTGNKGTSAGLQNPLASNDYISNKQSTLGNLFFTAVLRIDIIKVSDVKKLETEPLPLPLPARKAQVGVVSFQSFGANKSGN